ncbi:tudor domain-containing protein 7-like isoform X2 [Diachasmimorpha longicaudata]
MDRKQRMEEVMVALRSCLTSAKGGVPLHNLNTDYRSVQGEDIPYKDLGFATIDDFLAQDPRIRQHKKSGVMYVEVLPNESTVHLTALINKQKTSKRKPSRMETMSRQPMMSANSQTRQRYHQGYNNNQPQCIRRNHQPQTSGTHPGGRNSFSRGSGPSEVRSYPRSNGHSESVRSHPRSSGHTERHVIINPSRAGGKAEVPVTVYPAPVKPEPKVTTYPALPRAEVVPAVRAHPQNIQVNVNISRPKSPPSQAFQDRNDNGVRVSPPQTPRLTRFDGDRGETGIKVINPPGDQGKALRKGMKSLSERLRRSSPDHSIENVVISSAAVKTEDSNPLIPSVLEDPREALKALADRLNLSEPKYTTVHVGQGGKLKIFSKVEVGEHKFKSYPFDAVDETDAAQLAAVSALKELRRLYETPEEVRITEDKGLVMERILEIVDRHPNGVFRDRLPGFYKEINGEGLPQDWVVLVEQCEQLMMEKGVDNSVIVCRRLQIQRVKTSPSPRCEHPLLKPPTDSPTPLVLPSGILWPVYVSHVASTADVWIRLLEDEYNEKFFKMSQHLNAHYATVTESSPSVAILNHYVTKVNDELHRVRVEALDPLTGDAEIFFIDTGDTDVVDPSRLFPLDKKFLDVPPQAIRACLSSLEDIAVCDTTTDIAEKHLLDRTFYMQVCSRGDDELSHVVVGIFYDTNGETDVNVNEKISMELERIMELSKPEAQVTVKGRLLEVFVSHVQQNGDVYLQVNNDGMTILTSMLNSLVEHLLEDEVIVNSAVIKGKFHPDEVYLAQTPNGNWVRVQVSPTAHPNTMRCIDSGELVAVDLGKVLRLKDLSKSLARFPPQAINVEMNNFGRTRFNDRVACRMREIAAPGDVLLCKVVQVPVFGRSTVVELFKRSQPENLLISINNTLDLEPEVIKCGDGNNNVRKKRLERRGSRSSDEMLKPPKIPGVGECFNVRVTNLVPSPWNFVVQPFEEQPKLDAMMETLQETYKNLYVRNLMMEELEKGKVYAVKNHDGYWYRACINQVLDEQSVSVHLCDMGNIIVVTLSQVQPLKSEFFNLPYQAIKARLVGVQPIGGDWSLPTCLQFQKLVVNKNFASIIRRVDIDDSTPSETVVALELIDVALEDQDIYIHKILIDERRALPEAL